MHANRGFVALVDIGFNFGLRKGEMLALQVRDVDLLENWLTIRDSKNGDSRRIPLTRETVTLLAECIRGKEKNDFVLTHLDGCLGSEIAAKQGRVLASAGLGNGPGVDGSPSVHSAERRHRGHALHQLLSRTPRRRPAPEFFGTDLAC